MSENKPLVSVVVLTYNSSKFIRKTLDSVILQDYERLELIVSDDGSKDDTCKIVEGWMTTNSSSFERCSLIKSFMNRGTCKNYNQGVFNSHGDYIKTLDGDDTLNGESAISDYTHFLIDNQYEICISDVKVFSDEEYDMDVFRKAYDNYFKYISESLSEQKSRIIRELRLPDPGLFFSRQLYDAVGGFDEKYLLQEEWPFFMKVLDANYQIGALNKQLVCYQIASSSATHGKTPKSYVKRMCIKDNLDFFIDKRFKRLIKEGEYKLAFHQLYVLIKLYIEQFL